MSLERSHSFNLQDPVYIMVILIGRLIIPRTQ